MQFDESLPLEHSFGFIYIEWEDASKKLQKEFYEKLVACKATAKPKAELRTVEATGIRLHSCGLKWNRISNDDRLRLNEFFRFRFEAEQKLKPAEANDAFDV
jgi:hypothetical protein